MLTSAEQRFSYSGSLPAGGEISGTLLASDQATAVAILEKMGVAAGQVRPTMLDRESRQMASSDASAGPTFHQRLLRLVQSGLPTEFALRLLRIRTGGSPVGKGVANISRDLDSGINAVEAVARHRDEFPAECRPLLDAAAANNSLAATLISLQSHAQLEQNISRSLRRPLYFLMVVLVALLAILGLMRVSLGPMYQLLLAWVHRQVVDNFWTTSSPPRFIAGFLWLIQRIPPVIFWLAAATFAAICLGIILGNTRIARKPLNYLLCALPVAGPAMRLSLVACWCSALQSARRAGLDIPMAVEFAGALSLSGRVQADSLSLAAAIRQSGMACLAKIPPGKMLSKAVMATLLPALEQDSGPAAFAALANTWQQEAQAQVQQVLPLVATLCFVTVAVLIFAVMLEGILPLREWAWVFGGYS